MSIGALAMQLRRCDVGTIGGSCLFVDFEPVPGKENLILAVLSRYIRWREGEVVSFCKLFRLSVYLIEL